MTRTIPLLAVALFLAVGAAAQLQPSPVPPPGAPQQAKPPQAQPRGPIIVQTNMVIVPVTVKDSSGRLVGDLRRDEFRIFADGIEQQVTYFTAEAVPLSAVILVGTSLPRGAATQVQNSLRSIAAAFGPHDEAALVAYETFPETVLDFTANNDRLFTQLSRLELSSYTTVVAGGPIAAGPQVNGQPLPTGTGVKQLGSQRHQNTDALHDALFAAGDMLKDRGRDRRKMIFLISQGANSSKHNQHSFEDTLHHLQYADVSVFSISVTPTIRFAKSVLQRGAADIQKYTDRTGGDSFVASKQPDLERLYSDVTEQARNEYTLAFSPEGVQKDQDFHPIEVRITRPGLNISARQGYYQSAMTVGR